MRKIDSAGLLAAANEGDPKTRADRVCDADFFIGEDTLGARQVRAARQFFVAARKTCPIASPSFTGALAELRHRR
jgi:hypothetical protein